MLASPLRIPSNSLREAYRARGWWPGVRLERRYQETVRRSPGDLAVADDRGRRLTHAGLWRAAGEWAQDLAAVGIGVGDLVLVAIRNRIEWQVALLALLRRRAVPATLPTTTDPRTLSDIAQQTDARALIVARADCEAFLGVGAPPALLAFDGPEQRLCPLAAPTTTTPPAAPSELDHVMFTSSTTGHPKAVMHSADTLAALNLGFAERFALSSQTPLFMPSPLGHSVGAIHGGRLALYLGAPLILQDRWDPEHALRMIENFGCTFTAAATPFLKDLVDTPDARRPTPLRVFLCGGAPVPPTLIARAQELLPATCATVLWGMTEGGVTTGLPDTPTQLHGTTAGMPLPGLELHTVDARGVRLAQGEEGELAMRGPGVFIGYLGQERLYRSLLTEEGYFLTGDLAQVGDDGYLRITGRVKDLIIRGGVNISPVPIEHALASHPLVRRVAVIGAPDERLGERLCAVIEPSGPSPTLAQLITWVSERGLPRRLWPEALQVVAQMPTTPAGKIRKGELRERLLGA